MNSLWKRYGLFGLLTALAVGGRHLQAEIRPPGGQSARPGPGRVRTYITSQNHGYAVDGTSLPVGKVRFINANDGTCEGIDYPELRHLLSSSILRLVLAPRIRPSSLTSL